MYADTPVHVVREEIRNQTNNKYEVVDHTKTHTNRFIDIPNKAMEILDMIPHDSEYVFVRDGNRLHTRQIFRFLKNKKSARRRTRSGGPRTCADRSGAEKIELWGTAVPQNNKKDIHSDVFLLFLRARDGDRTRDPLLGKEVLHRWATRAYCTGRNLYTEGMKLITSSLTLRNLSVKGMPMCLHIEAGDGNRTHVSSLEGWCSTIELHPHIC